jgi:hypothetical protein
MRGEDIGKAEKRKRGKLGNWEIGKEEKRESGKLEKWEKEAA